MRSLWSLVGTLISGCQFDDCVIQAGHTFANLKYQLLEMCQGSSYYLILPVWTLNLKKLSLHYRLFDTPLMFVLWSTNYYVNLQSNDYLKWSWMLWLWSNSPMIVGPSSPLYSLFLDISLLNLSVCNSKIRQKFAIKCCLNLSWIWL